MDAGSLGRLVLHYTVIRGGATVAVGWGTGAVVGIEAAMVGLVAVLVGGVIAGMTLFATPSAGSTYLHPIAVPFVQTLDPLVHAGEPPGSRTTRRFFYGVGVLVLGGGLLVLGG